MSERICFNTYGDWEGTFQQLDADTCKELIMAVFSYGLRKELPDLSYIAKIGFSAIRPLLDRDWQKYEERCNRNKTNGLSGGRPKTQNNPAGFTETQNNPENPVGFSETQNNPIINKKQEIKNKKQEDKDLESIDSLSVNTDAESKVDYIEIAEFYNKTANSCNITACVRLTDKRKAAIRARLKEYGKERVYEAITKVAQSSFCNGHNNRNWKADIDFVFNANKMARILEGKYDNEIITYGNNGNSNEQSTRSVGEKVLGDIFAEIEQRQRTERTNG